MLSYLIEMLLQLLICEIDAKLLKTATNKKKILLKN